MGVLRPLFLQGPHHVWGGEWRISSIALENIAVFHTAVAEAAIIAARHPKWQERLLLVVVLVLSVNDSRSRQGREALLR